MASRQEGSTDGLDVCLVLLEQETDSASLQSALLTIQKIIRNIQQNPTEEKYRKLRKENAAFRNKVWRFEGAQQFLFAIGFVDVGDEIIVPDDSQLQTGLACIDTVLSQHAPTAVAPKTTPPAKSEKLTEKEKLLAEERKKQLRAMQRDKEEKKRINDQIKADRKDTGTRETKSSQARQMKFGATQTTFKDIGIDLNKGGG